MSQVNCISCFVATPKLNEISTRNIRLGLEPIESTIVGPGKKYNATEVTSYIEREQAKVQYEQQT